EAGQLAVVGNGHNARHDGDVDAHLFTTVDEVEIAVRVEKILGNGAISTGIDLALEVLQVVFGTDRLGVKLRIGGHFDIEVITAVFADIFHQLIGIAQLTGRPHAGG